MGIFLRGETLDETLDSKHFLSENVELYPAIILYIVKNIIDSDNNGPIWIL